MNHPSKIAGFRNGKLVTALAIACWVTAPAARAQDTAPAGAKVGDDAFKTLATVTVTAQKREEARQDVPVTVTALPQPLLQDVGVHDLKDMQVLVPGLTVTSTQSEAQTTIRIRGIGTVGDNAGLESSVGVVIDGVYRPRNGVGFGDLGELERIEVLKGPQSTVYGKNTSAGVVNVVTRAPDFETSAEGELTAGNYGALGIAGAFNAPLGDSAAFRVHAARRKRDGFLDIVPGPGPRTETKDGDQDFGSARAQLLLEPSDDLRVRLIADATRRNEHCCVGVTTVRGPTAPIIDALAGGQGVITEADPGRRLAYANRGDAQDIRDQGVSAQVDWDNAWLGGATLTSITAWRDWRSINGIDFDYSTADLIYRNADKTDAYTRFQTFSQEFRLAGTQGRLDWLLGAFYSDEDLDRNESYRVGAAYEPYLSIALLAGINPALAASPTAPLFISEVTGLTYGTAFTGHDARDRYRQNARSAALFTNNTWHATDALALTLGLRYTRERKTLDSAYANPNGSPGCSAYFDANGALSAEAIGRIATAVTTRGVPFATLPAGQQQAIIGSIVGYSCLPWANRLHDGRATAQERTERAWSGAVKAAYRWNDHVMGFASAARGYKAGGFNLDRVQSSNGLSSGGAGIVPVDDTAFTGEFVDSYELGARTTWDDGDLLLNATLFHQVYSDFQLNSFLGTSFVVRSVPKVTSRGLDAEVVWQPAKAVFIQSGATYADTRYGDALLPDADLAALPGSTASFAPKWSLTTALTYTRPLAGEVDGRFTLGAKYMSDYNTGSDLDAAKEQPAYALVDARVAFGPRDGRWAIEFWGRNLADKVYQQVGYDAPLQAGSWNAFLGAPRTYGVTFRARH